MSERIAEVITRYSVDERSLRKSNKAAQSSIDKWREIQDAAIDTRRQTLEYGKDAQQSIARVDQRFDQLNQTADTGIEIVQRLRREIKLTDREAANARGVDIYADRYRSVSDFVSVFGDIDTNLAPTASFASGLGATGAGQGIGIATDIFAVAEGLPRLGEGLVEINRRIINSNTAVGQFARGITGTLTPAIGAGRAALVSLAAVSLPLTAAVIGVGIAVERFNDQLETGRQRLEAALEAQDAYYDSLLDFTSEDAAEEIDSLRRRRDLLQQQLDETRAAEEGAFRQQQAAVTDFGARLIDLLGGPSSQLREQRKELESELLSVTDTITRLEGGLSDNAFAFNDAAAAAEELQREEEELTQTRQQAADRLADLEQRELDRLEDFQLESSRLTEDRQLRDLRSQEDYQIRAEQSQKQHQDRLTDIQSRGQKQQESITQQTAKSVNDTIATVRLRETKITKDYQREALRDAQQFSIDRLRQQEDLALTLQEAEEDNNVVAFLRAKRQGDRDLERDEEDFERQRDLRREDAEIRLEETREEGQLRIAEIKARGTEQLTLLKQQTREQIDTQRNAFLKQRALEEQERERQLERQQQDDLIQDQRRVENTLRQLELLEVQQDAQREIVEQATTDIATIQTQLYGEAAQDIVDLGIGAISAVRSKGLQLINDIFTTQPIPSTPSVGSGSTFSYSIPGGYVDRTGIKNKVGFADGGIVPAGASGFGFFEPNRRFAEAVIPLSPDNLAAVGAGGTTINFGDITVPSGVSADEVKQALEDMAYAILEGIQDARIGRDT